MDLHSPDPQQALKCAFTYNCRKPSSMCLYSWKQNGGLNIFMVHLLVNFLIAVIIHHIRGNERRTGLLWLRGHVIQAIMVRKAWWGEQAVGVTVHLLLEAEKGQQWSPNDSYPAQHSSTAWATFRLCLPFPVKPFLTFIFRDRPRCVSPR